MNEAIKDGKIEHIFRMFRAFFLKFLEDLRRYLETLIERLWTTSTEIRTIRRVYNRGGHTEMFGGFFERSQLKKNSLKE
ncbi:hypothetical protein MHLP_02285 [Candidatus Mycoplasma haematolamae str. Purdue]|uniref:Uncharacterized protein n=1 Tax=Mycoplasma haematolamae (strain Purdue) TaxID=1212765 RepID=I7C6B3_MYCHA|nr:hypothetical protein MHLP_02285 [Candidatus Mycoplasma haematolamae str. Purdue]